MKFGELLEFRKDLYFEGAVQIDWFYDQKRAAKVAENFVFHGKDYFGVEEITSGGKKRIDTVGLVQALSAKLGDDTGKVPSLAIADYGTGKSHLAVTLGQLFSGPDYMPETFNKVISNIRTIDADAAKEIEENCDGRNFVMVINGMRDFNLHSEILKAAQKSLSLYGLPDDNLRKLNRALETAEMFFNRNSKTAAAMFEKAAEDCGWFEKGERLEKRIKEELLSNDEAFEIVNKVYTEINGQEIRWDEGLSASTILEMLVTEYCGMNGKFDHVILLFDEFGRYLEYASGVNAAKSGDSALQQIFESAQNADGVLQVINFIQSDIKTYLDRVDQTKNISRYIGRYDVSDKYYISSNLETVFANLIQRKDKDAFNGIIIKWQKNNEAVWKTAFDQLNRWLITKGMWRDYKLFRKVVIEGIYPMHPLSTFMLTQLSDYLQNRSSLTLISQYIQELSDREVAEVPVLIMPEYLMKGDLYVEMLVAEQEGRQKSQQCIRYDNILRKFEDKLSEKSLTVLRANLILRILRFRTLDYADAKAALSFASGLSISEIEEELNWLENEYAVLGFDDHAGCFDFMEESNGAHDFKVIKKRLIASAEISADYINTLKIQEIAGVLDVQTTNFGTSHKITTSEWQFKQQLYPIEEFTEAKADAYIAEWRGATTSLAAKGQLIWLYVNKDTDPECVSKAQLLVKKFENTPIVVMLVNDEENRLFNCLVEYYVFDTMDDINRKKYERHFEDGFRQAESNLKDEFEELKKLRIRILPDKVESVRSRMAIFLTGVFDDIYPNAVPFWFDGLVTKGNKLSGKAGTYYCSIIKMLLSGSVNSDSIHNFASDIKNRIDATLMTTSNTSWKCINEQYRMIPPENKAAKLVYDDIVKNLNDGEEKACADIFSKFSKPPYGMSEDIITLMIAVVCANLSYCLRFKYKGSVTNINNWKELVVIKDKKIDVSVIRESVFIVVDAGEVIGKYKRLFALIQDNRLMSEVNGLEKRLQEMTAVDEVPEEIEIEYLLAKNLLDNGLSAQKGWHEALSAVEGQYDEALENGSLYNALKALEGLENLPIRRYFSDSGFDYDDDTKRSLGNLRKAIISFIDENIDPYVGNMYCKGVEHLTTFRNHNTKMQKLLEELGFHDYAVRVENQKNKELENVSEIKSRQELRGDYTKFIAESKMDRFTSYIAIKDFIKNGKELQARVAKYRNSLGKDGGKIQTDIESRVQELEAAKARIEQDITDIWDDLLEAKSSEDIQDLIDRINLVLQKGISSNDQSSLEEIKRNLEEFLVDVNRISETNSSRIKFGQVSSELREKYSKSDFDFDVNDILDGIIMTISNELDEKEKEWRMVNLTLGDKSRQSVHSWKERIKYLPDYLSEQTLGEIRKLEVEADTVIREGKIEDVVFYFNRLDFDEKVECLSLLKLNVPLEESKRKSQIIIPTDLEIRDYQEEAIINWRNNGYRGVYDMATGTGKTITAILSIKNLEEHCNGRLGVVILCPYRHLVDQWIENLTSFGVDPIVGYSGSKYGDFSRILESKVRRFNRDKEDFFVFLTTNETFKRNDVQYILKMFKGKLLLVSDEAHTMGTEGRLVYLTDYYDYRLALSATFERNWDEEGTVELYRFFGKTVFRYTLEKAIENGVLTPYEYIPIVCNLDEDEYKEYIRLSKELQKYLLYDEENVELSDQAKLLLIQRARVVAGARDKLRKLDELLFRYHNEGGMLVYCGATNVFMTEERQLDAVTYLLVNKHGITANQFTCEETMDERKILLRKLESGETQALIAIKCLDEGVNIPSVRTAFILASANNSKEYIQRRGRVLRRSSNKEKAVIYDFIALPFTDKSHVEEILVSGTKYDLSLVKREIIRIIEFGKLAINTEEVDSIKNEICERFGIINCYDKGAEL